MRKDWKPWSAADGSFGVGANGKDICTTKTWEEADLIARALRTLDQVQKPGELLLCLDKKVREKISSWPDKPEPRHYVDWVLAAFREATS